MPATMSILGLYRWDETLFDGMVLPSKLAADPEGKTLVTTEILAQCAELEVLYTNPVIMKSLIHNWSLINREIFQKLEDTLYFDYDPIYNYDRTESEHYSSKKTDTGSGNSSQNGETAYEEYKAGYNAPSTVKSGNTTDTSSSSGNSSYTADTGEETTREVRAYGNIGVTTTQQMIESERQVVQFNLVQFIVDSFKRRFCVLIY